MHALIASQRSICMDRSTLELSGMAIKEVQEQIGASSRSDLIHLIAERSRSEEFEYISESTSVSERSLRKWWSSFRSLSRKLQTRAIIEACAEADLDARNGHH